MLHSTELHIVPPIIAHRGANRLAPENTLAAFLKAKQLGFNWVEFDVMLSADHELVVIHDEELMRTTNARGAVIDYSYNDLSKLDAGSWFNPIFSQERISRLQTVLDFLYEHQLSANIEIKALQHCNQVVAQKVWDMLKQQAGRFVSPPLISSFSLDVLKYIRNQSADCRLAFLMDEWITDWKIICDELTCVSVNVNQDLLTEERVRIIKATGRQLLSYTVNEKARAEQLYAWGVNAIFSDCPQGIIDMVR